MKLNKKGFTLVELLAVIVILAVVMLVAVTAVGPAITNSKKGAFFSSASSLVDAAALYASANGITGDKCLSDVKLKNAGYLNSKDANFKGEVLIKVDGNQYQYKIIAINNDFYVGTVGSATAETSYIDVSTLRNAKGEYQNLNNVTDSTKLTYPTKIGTITCENS